MTEPNSELINANPVFLSLGVVRIVKEAIGKLPPHAFASKAHQDAVDLIKPRWDAAVNDHLHDETLGKHRDEVYVELNEDEKSTIFNVVNYWIEHAEERMEDDPGSYGFMKAVMEAASVEITHAFGMDPKE